MTDSTDKSGIVDQAIKRLKALAEGNGMEPDSIKLMQSETKDYTLEAVMYFTPLCDVENKQYIGPPSGKVTGTFPDVAALNAEVTRRRNAFRERSDWIPDVQTELQTAPGLGWGMDGVNVTLTKLNIVLAAVRACPQCNGSRNITCTQCQGAGSSVCAQCRGQGQELCITCGGTGQNPQDPGQPCVMCRGTTRMICRVCHGKGQAVCPVCGGKRSMACTACKATGQITEEAHLVFGATTRFDLKSSGLPSVLRRGLDRLDIPNLAKGHADIEIVTPEPEKDEADEQPAIDAPPRPAAPKPMLHYQAKMPFSELRVDFGGKKAIVGIFGKRNVLIDVPAFLDNALQPFIAKLRAAAQGQATLSEAIKARALNDALKLELQGQGNVKELRRLYPFGLTPKTAEDITRMMRMAIKRTTLHIRTIVAVIFGLIGSGIFGATYFTSLPQYVPPQPRWYGFALGFAPLVIIIGLGWALLNFTTRFFLQRNFPNMKIAAKQSVGKTGISLTAALILLWAIILVLSPARPVWLPFFH